MSRILLTGATGYLGSHLAHAFLDERHEVAILKRSSSSLDRISDIAGQLEMFDLDQAGIEQPFRKPGKIDVIVHAATCYGKKGESAFDVFQANTVFPLELLETATRFNVETFINTDTFFNTETIQYGYLNAYSLSKKQFSQWGEIYAKSEKIRFLNIRIEHLFGPGDDPAKFTTWIVHQCLKNVSSIPLTAGEQKRDFIFINDVVTAYTILLEKMNEIDFGWQEVGLGRGASISLRDFVEIVLQCTGSTSRLDFGALPYRSHEIMDSCADTGFLKSIGWQPETELEKAVTNVVEHERRHKFC